MTDNHEVPAEDLEAQEGELLPDREAMSVLSPTVDPRGELFLPSEPGIGDPTD
jgi:hypothetical protein